MVSHLRRTFSLAAATLALILVTNPPAAAVTNTIFNSAGFEPPSFVPGSVIGQSGWNTAGFGGSFATVQTGVVFAGSQALRVDRSPNSERYWGYSVPAVTPLRYITIDWRMRYEQATNEAFGPFFGAVAEDGQGVVGKLGAFGIDAATQDVLYEAEGTGIILETGATAPPNVWNRFTLELDFLTDRYNGYVNGSLVHSQRFTDYALGLNEFTVGIVATFQSGTIPASAAKTGTAYFDNFIVWESDVRLIPEPTALILALTGFLFGKRLTA
jgi:hypothetical protein